MKSKKQELSEQESEFESKARIYRFLANLFQVLSNPTRLQILDFLARNERIQRDKRGIPESKVRGGLYQLLGDLFKILSNPIRIQIIDLLYSHGQCPIVPLSQMRYKIRKKPQTIIFHINKLSERGLVEEVKKGKYQITESGILVRGTSAIYIIGVVEGIIEIGKTKKIIVKS